MSEPAVARVAAGQTAPSLRGGSVARERLKILLVDDEPKNLIALESLLEGDGRELVRATSGFDALRRLLEDDYALILLDVRMPEMDGFETAELIRERERSRETPIIFLTAAARGEFPMARGYALGAVDYIIKPVDPDVLRFKVAVFADLYRKTAEVRQQAEELAENHAFLDSILEGVTEHAIAGLDREGRVLVWNEGARRIYGHPAERMLGRPASILAATGPEQPDFAGLLDRVDREGHVRVECEHVRASGQRFPVMLTLTQRSDEAGNPAGYVFLSRDLTSARQAEEARALLVEEQAARAAAEAEQRRLQQLVDVMPEAVLITDAGGRLTLLNEEGRRLLGDLRPGIDLLAAAPSRMLTPEGEACPPQSLPLPRVLQGGEPVRGEQYVVAAANGRQVPVLVSAASVSDGGDGVLAAVMVLQDISVLRNLDRQKDDFLAAVAHDLRNPLTVIAGHAQLLERRASRLGDPEAAFFVDLLRAVNRTTRRATALVNELLDITRIQMRRPLQLDLRRCDLATIAGEAVVEFRRTTDRHHISMQGHGDATGHWDRERLYRVVANLLENAVKFSPDGGAIDVCVRSLDGPEGEPWAEVTVRDEGVGIPPEDLPLIFERFYRAGNVAGRIDGSGIGLTAARQVVEAHGGTIEVESAPGRGTTVAVRLPSRRVEG
jgi:PAS domain S-box-containing protein